MAYYGNIMGNSLSGESLGSQVFMDQLNGEDSVRITAITQMDKNLYTAGAIFSAGNIDAPTYTVGGAPISTSHVIEGSRLYFTEPRVLATLTGTNNINIGNGTSVNVNGELVTNAGASIGGTLSTPGGISITSLQMDMAGKPINNVSTLNTDAINIGGAPLSTTVVPEGTNKYLSAANLNSVVGTQGNVTTLYSDVLYTKDDLGNYVQVTPSSAPRQVKVILDTDGVLTAYPYNFPELNTVTSTSDPSGLYLIQLNTPDFIPLYKHLSAYRRGPGGNQQWSINSISHITNAVRVGFKVWSASGTDDELVNVGSTFEILIEVEEF